MLSVERPSFSRASILKHQLGAPIGGVLIVFSLLTLFRFSVGCFLRKSSTVGSIRS